MYLCISAGFEGTRGDVSRMYRVQDIPGLGFMVKMAVLHQHMLTSMKQCCGVR